MQSNHPRSVMDAVAALARGMAIMLLSLSAVAGAQGRRPAAPAPRVPPGKKVRPELELLFGHSSWVTSVAFSPDGKTVASGSKDAAIKLWDASTGSLKRTLNAHGGVALNAQLPSAAARPSLLLLPKRCST